MNDRLGIVTTFIHNIVVYNIPLLYGTVGEILIEKSGSLNLGVEGIMAVGAIFGYIVGCYANSLLVGVLAAFLTAALCGLLFAVLTGTLALGFGGLLAALAAARPAQRALEAVTAGGAWFAPVWLLGAALVWSALFAALCRFFRLIQQSYQLIGCLGGAADVSQTQAKEGQ